MIATASADDYRRAIAAMAEAEELDALIAIFIRPLLTRAEDVAAALREAAGQVDREIPILAVLMSEAEGAASGDELPCSHTPRTRREP